MPIYEYVCLNCNHTFERFWHSIKAAEEAGPPACPSCHSDATRRIVSQVAVLGSIGGLTPGEQAAAKAQEERLASVTPRDLINKLQAGTKSQKSQ
jgi:putative FmdB family regulatory protein